MLFSKINQVVWHLVGRSRGINIACGPLTSIWGLSNIVTKGSLRIATARAGLDKGQTSIIRVEGELLCKGDVKISRGAKIEIKQGARVRLCSCSLGASKFVILSGLDIGEGTMISWDCLIIDSHIHGIVIDGVLKDNTKPIRIGANCWIGANCTILPGTNLPDGTIVAAGSVVSGLFSEPNSLIGGVPAKLIKSNVSWVSDTREWRGAREDGSFR